MSFLPRHLIDFVHNKRTGKKIEGRLSVSPKDVRDNATALLQKAREAPQDLSPKEVKRLDDLRRFLG